MRTAALCHIVSAAGAAGFAILVPGAAAAQEIVEGTCSGRRGRAVDGGGAVFTVRQPSRCPSTPGGVSGRCVHLTELQRAVVALEN